MNLLAYSWTILKAKTIVLLHVWNKMDTILSHKNQYFENKKFSEVLLSSRLSEFFHW